MIAESSPAEFVYWVVLLMHSLKKLDLYENVGFWDEYQLKGQLDCRVQSKFFPPVKVSAFSLASSYAKFLITQFTSKKDF